MVAGLRSVCSESNFSGSIFSGSIFSGSIFSGKNAIGTSDSSDNHANTVMTSVTLEQFANTPTDDVMRPREIERLWPDRTALALRVKVHPKRDQT